METDAMPTVQRATTTIARHQLRSSYPTRPLALPPVPTVPSPTMPPTLVTHVPTNVPPVSTARLVIPVLLPTTGNSMEPIVCLCLASMTMDILKQCHVLLLVILASHSHPAQPVWSAFTFLAQLVFFVRTSQTIAPNAQSRVELLSARNAIRDSSSIRRLSFVMTFHAMISTVFPVPLR